MELLFSYGTLHKADIQQELFGRELEGVKDILSGYSLSIIESEGKVYLALDSDPNREVEGLVYELTLDELTNVDQYEGNNYKRVKERLFSGKEAWVYVQA